MRAAKTILKEMKFAAGHRLQAQRMFSDDAIVDMVQANRLAVKMIAFVESQGVLNMMNDDASPYPQRLAAFHGVREIAYRAMGVEMFDFTAFTCDRMVKMGSYLATLRNGMTIIPGGIVMSLQSIALDSYIEGLAHEHVAKNGGEGRRVRQETAARIARDKSSALPDHLHIEPEKLAAAIFHASPDRHNRFIGEMEDATGLAVSGFKEEEGPDGMLSCSYMSELRPAPPPPQPAQPPRDSSSFGRGLKRGFLLIL